MTHTRRMAAMVVACVASVVSLILLSSTAAPAQASGASSVLFVLDSSGSMNAQESSGVRLIDGAKAAISRVARDLPTGSAMGLRVYGSQYAGNDKAIGCKDTRLVLPVAATDPTQVNAAMAGFKAVGETPIGYTLRQTPGDFAGRTGDRVVILVSDGQDNCSEPGAGPCEIAKQLRHDEITLRIETVGLNLAQDQAARAQLQCVASATGGKYYDAKDTSALARRLNEIARRVVQNFSLGERTSGGVSPAEAPVLDAGVYLDTLRPGQAKWYAFDVPAGRTPQAIAAIAAAARLPASQGPGKRDCMAWEARLLSRALEAGDYAPYYNVGPFDGSGGGYTAVRSVGPTSENTGGLDYPGRWYVRLSLAEDTIKTCSSSLPVEDYKVQLTLQRLTPGDEGDAPQPSALPTGATGAEAEAAPEAVQKYFRAPSPGTPAWVYPVVATLLVTLVGGGFVGYRLYRKAHYF